jgi:hypothetical protein
MFQAVRRSVVVGAVLLGGISACGSSGDDGSPSVAASASSTGSAQNVAKARASARDACILNDRLAAGLIPVSQTNTTAAKIASDLFTAALLDPKWKPLQLAVHQYATDVGHVPQAQLAVEGLNVIQLCSHDANIGYIPPGTPGKTAGPVIHP